MPPDQQLAPDRIASVLVAEIRDGTIAVGAPLPPERELCERFGVSRPTIRTSLQMLHARGFASLEATRRPRAQKPTLSSVFDTAGRELAEMLGGAETMAHLDQIRQFIEVGAVRQAAREASNLEVTQIHRALERCFAALDDDDAFARTDAEFHRTIVSVVRNPLILALHDRFVGRMLASRSTGAAREDRNRESYEEHRQIFEAIAAGDSERAMAVMESHLARAYRNRLPTPARTGQPNRSSE